MYLSTLGQTATTQQQQVVTTQVVYRQPGIAIPAYYSPQGMVFSRRTATGTPGPLYATNINPEEIEKAVYKDLPEETKEEKEVIGTEPQKIIKLRSGLEIPAYILQRDIARKQAKLREEEALANIPPPKYYKIGVFATQKPARAALMAAALGYICGHIIYSFR